MKFDSVEGLFANTDQLKGKIKEKVESSKEIGLIANELNIDTLVLSHILYWGSNDLSILKDVKESFSGNIIVASDSLVINQ